MILFLNPMHAAPMTGRALVGMVAARLSKVKSLSVTLTSVYANPERRVVESFTLLRGGYMRYKTGQTGQPVIVTSTPTSAWTFWPAKKEFEKIKPAPKGTSQNPFIGMPGLFGDMGMSAIGNARLVDWHGRKAYQVELDASKKIPKHPHLIVFFSQDTKLPLGFELTQMAFKVEGTYTALRLDPPVKPQEFDFRPGPGWKPASPVRH